MKNVIEVIKANKETVIKKTLIVAGTLVGLALVSKVFKDEDEDDIEVVDAEVCECDSDSDDSEE